MLVYPSLLCGIVCVILHLAVLVELRLVTHRRMDRQTSGHSTYCASIQLCSRNYSSYFDCNTQAQLYGVFVQIFL